MSGSAPAGGEPGTTALALSREAVSRAEAGDWEAVQALQGERETALKAAGAAAGDRDTLEELKRLNDRLLALALEHRAGRVAAEAASRRQGNALSEYLKT